MALAPMRVFWLWIGVGVLLVALGAAAIASGYVRDQAPNLSYFEGSGGTIIFSCNIFGCVHRFDPTPWFAAGGALVALALVPFAVAVRRR